MMEEKKGQIEQLKAEHAGQEQHERHADRAKLARDEVAHLLDAKGERLVRPYTPISTNAMMGKFELMINKCFCR